MQEFADDETAGDSAMTERRREIELYRRRACPRPRRRFAGRGRNHEMAA
jgi:hypothetical protein